MTVHDYPQHQNSNMKNPTDYPVHEVIGDRWSPYAFDANKTVDSAVLRSLFEAARWAMSSNNVQPWRYIVADRATDGALWNQVLDCLAEGNRPWAQHVPVLALGLAELNFEHNGKPNPTALHDLGAASAFLTIEATSRGLVVHQMAGILPDKIRSTFSIADTAQPLTALAIGYEGSNPELDETYARRDARQRERKPFSEIILRGNL